MDVVEAITTRKSVRDFKSDPVSREIIEKILRIASRAPSAMNTQPWEFIVLANNVLDSVRREVLKKVRAQEKPHSEHSVVGWPRESVYRQRQVELAKEIFRLMDIGREDADKRSAWIERGFLYFNAPAVIVICVDRQLEKGTPIFDIGAVTQNICLVALQCGLGTCIEDQGVMYPEVLRKYCEIPDSKQIVIAVAIGYPNVDFPANRLETSREPVDAITTWCGL